MQRLIIIASVMLLLGAGCQTMNVHNADAAARTVILKIPDRDRLTYATVPAGEDRVELMSGSGVYMVVEPSAAEKDSVDQVRNGLKTLIDASFAAGGMAEAAPIYDRFDAYQALLADLAKDSKIRCSLRIGEDEDGIATIESAESVTCGKRLTPEPKE